MNYLYNGVELPALPEWDKKTYPYAALWYQINANDSTYIFLTVSVEKWHCDNTYLLFENDSKGQVYRVLVAGGTEFEYVRETEDVTGTSGGIPKGYFLWANHDIKDANGTLYLAASEPVPVYGWETLWDGPPEVDGVVTGYNGDFFWLWYSSEGNKNRLSTGDVVRVTVDGTVSTLTVLAGPNDKTAEAGNKWLESNSATDDGTDVYFWEYGGALRFFTREFYYDEMPHVKFERAITVPVSPVKLNPALLVQSFFTGQAVRRSRGK